MEFIEEEDRESLSESDNDHSDVEEDDEWKRFNQNAKNSLLSVGYKSGDSFVTRGSQVGVFSVDAKSRNLKYRARIDNIRTPSKGQLFTPTKSMLHQQDSKMLLLNKNESAKKIYQMDLERGQVVEEWTVHDDYPVLELFPKSKYEQMENTQVVQGLNSLGLCTIDPRLPKNKMVENQSSFYNASSKPMLSCAATTREGAIAVGSKKGDIRLFSANLLDNRKDLLSAPKAKTTLPGFGDPILGIDVSSDGKWILATCATYLVVIPSEAEGKNGFQAPLGKNKPAPRRLTLKPQDIKLIGKVLVITNLSFNHLLLNYLF